MRDGWEIKKVGEVCEIINGFAFKSQLFKDRGDDILRISNIQNGVVVDDDIAHFSKNDYPKVDFDKYTVFPNDIVVALSGATTGKFGINNTGRKLYLNQRVAICREKTNDMHHRFLLYFLKTQSNSFLESAAGVAQPNLSTEQIKLYEIPIPSISEQERIVAELDLLSGIIEKQKQQLKEYDTLAQSIFYTMFGDPITNEKGWEVKKLEDFCSFSQGVQVDLPLQSSSPKEGWNRFLRISDYTTDNAEIRYVDIQDKRFYVQLDDVVIVRYGASAGYVGVFKEGVLANNLFKLNHKRTIVNNIYLYYSLLTDYYKSYIKKVAFGAAMPALSFNSLRDFCMIIPPLSLQQEFAKKIEAIEKQKELIKQSIAETETLFNSRMDYYFN